MIEKNEVIRIAKNENVRADTVEKDYVLGWMLNGISQANEISDWIFKGGTSLKKCFFETFRFSEDLDFTLKHNSPLDSGLLIKIFTDLTERLSEDVGIAFFPDRFTFDVMDKIDGTCSAQGRIHYRGPLNRSNSTATIKLDLTTDEVVVLEPERRPVIHNYTDAPEGGIHVNCYAFEEVVAEKIRALAERIRPRDLYDVIHFFRNRKLIKNPQLVYEVLAKKCAFKNIGIPTFQTIEQHEKLDELAPQWENMLGHQLPSLPPLESFWDQLQPFFLWLQSQLKEHQLPKSSVITGQSFQVGQLQGGFRGDISDLNKIQFAAANRLCINLHYHNRTRTVEPLSFRINTQNGNQLFYGFERNAGHVKCYSIAKFQSVEITGESYIEQYPVEISASGPIQMPSIQ